MTEISAGLNDLELLGVLLEERESTIVLNLEKLYRLDYYLYEENLEIKFGLISQLPYTSNVRFYMSPIVPKSSVMYYSSVKLRNAPMSE